MQSSVFMLTKCVHSHTSSVSSAESRLFVKVYMVPCNSLSYFIDRNSAPEQCLASSL